MVLFAYGCRDVPPRLPVTPECSWVNDERVKYVNLTLKHPTNELPDYKNAYPFEAIYSLYDIYGSHYSQSESNIKITIVAQGCKNTSKSQTFNKNNYHNRVFQDEITGLYGVTNSNGYPKVTIEVKSGKHTDVNGNRGFVVWSKVNTEANPYALQNGTFQGRFVISDRVTSSILIKEQIYIGDQFEQQMLR